MEIKYKYFNGIFDNVYTVGKSECSFEPLISVEKVKC